MSGMGSICHSPAGQVNIVAGLSVIMMIQEVGKNSPDQEEAGEVVYKQEGSRE